MDEITEDTVEVDQLDNPNTLTDWKNEPTVAQLKQNLDDAELDQDTHKANLERWERLMENKRKVSKDTNRSKVAPRLVRKQAEWRYSSLSEPFLSSPDLFDARPTTPGDVNRANQNSLVLNKQFNTQLDRVAFINAYIREAVDTGTVIIKTGWDSIDEKVTETVPTYEYVFEPTGALAAQYQELAMLRQQDPEGYAEYSTPGIDNALTMYMQTGQAFEAIENGEEEVTSIKETRNQPTWEIPDSRNIIVDPSCNGNIKKARFWGERFKSSVAELQADGKYHNLDQIDKEAESPIANPDYEENKDISTFSFKDKTRKQFVVENYWGLWDIHNDGTLHQIIGSWVGDTLIRMELNPFPDKMPPFVLAVYMPVRRSVWGEPDAELLGDNQDIIGAVTRGMIDIMGKSANGQTGMRKDLLDVTNKRRFRKGLDYEFNAVADPRQGIHTHTFPEIPQSAYNMLTLQNADAESLTGVKAFSSGITGASLGDSVANGRSVLDAASKREVDVLRRLAAGIVEFGRKIIAMNAVFLSDEEVVRITDDRFIQVRRDDLQGKFDLQLTISTAEEDNKKAEELAYLLQTMGPNQDPTVTKMIQSKMADLRKMPELAKQIKEYEPQPDPMQVAKAEKELQLLDAQIAKENALTAKHTTEAQANGMRGAKDGAQANLNQAKAGTEIAKTNNISSDSTKKDLDNADQFTGRKHRQDMEKDDNRAKNDASLKVVDKRINPDTPNQNTN